MYSVYIYMVMANHTHTHAHTRTHARTHARTRAHTHTHTHTHNAHTHLHTRAHTGNSQRPCWFGHSKCAARVQTLAFYRVPFGARGYPLPTPCFRGTRGAQVGVCAVRKEHVSPAKKLSLVIPQPSPRAKGTRNTYPGGCKERTLKL